MDEDPSAANPYLRSLSRRFTVYRITGLEKIGRRITRLQDYRISKHRKTEARVRKPYDYPGLRGFPVYQNKRRQRRRRRQRARR